MPEHSHPQEQIAHVIKGRMKLIVAGVPHELAAGDAFYLASNVPHGVETIEDTTVIDTFSPPRNDYLALDEKARQAVRMKIISGGQTGVDRAALDAALSLGVDCGGWCPEGRLDENGIIPPYYPLQELPGGGYLERTARNVRTRMER